MSTIKIYDNDLIGMRHVRDEVLVVRYHHYINFIHYDNTCVFTYTIDNGRNVVPTYDFGDYDIRWLNPRMDVWGIGDEA